jgi:hypothetical protein
MWWTESAGAMDRLGVLVYGPWWTDLLLIIV